MQGPEELVASPVMHTVAHPEQPNYKNNSEGIIIAFAIIKNIVCPKGDIIGLLASS